ncbi:MAG TPA: ABC transporter substrate-binding protein [Acidimicrobiales bacterium]|jgi:ABC-type transport system substrate-binding protein|nr:ABC transporter substrate-binding protein [Acidimicrobiales bacterium]
MSDAIDRRRFLAQGIRTAAGVAVLGGGASTLLAACSSGGSSSTSTGTNAGVSTATPKPGGTVTFATEAEIDGFDPTKNRWDSTGILYSRTVYDNLTTIDATGAVKPYLAQSITPNSDFTKWTITIRPNVVFHNGTPLTAAAVKTNLDAVRAALLTGPALSNIASVDVTDPMTVVVSMKAPWVPFPLYLTTQTGVVVEPANLLSGNCQQHPIGTGPYVFQQWVPNDHFTSTKNPHYWRQGLPYVDQVTFRPIPDPQSRENSLKSGTVDMMHSSDTQNLVDLQGDSSFVTIDDTRSVFEPDMDFVMLNTAVAPMNDIRVRQALAYAIDKKKVINTVWNGLPPQSFGPFVQGSPYFGPTGYPDFNLAKAQSLVKQYQAEKGPISFEFGTINTPKALEINQLVQAMWKQAGIQTQIAQVEQTQFILNALQGKYQAYSWRQFATPDPDANYVWWSAGTAAPVGSLALNFARNNDPQVQQALDQGRASADPAVRSAAYQSIAKRFAVDFPYLWINRAIWMVSAKPRVQNFAGATLPDGSKAPPMIDGIVSTTQMWVNS